MQHYRKSILKLNKKNKFSNLRKSYLDLLLNFLKKIGNFYLLFYYYAKFSEKWKKWLKLNTFGTKFCNISLKAGKVFQFYVNFGSK